MTVTNTYTNRDICTDALRKINVTPIDEEAEADHLLAAKRALDRMLKSWQARGYNLWTASRQSVILTTASVYTLDPVRPLQILNCNFKRNGIETPMQQMTRDEYDTLPQKTTQGTPTTFYYDRQREAARLYIWPVLSAASGETLEISYSREIEDIDLDEAVDVPGEWLDAVVYGLAARLADDFRVTHQMVVQRAERELELALSFDQEGSIYWHDYDGDC